MVPQHLPEGKIHLTNISWVTYGPNVKYVISRLLQICQKINSGNTQGKDWTRKLIFSAMFHISHKSWRLKKMSPREFEAAATVSQKWQGLIKLWNPMTPKKIGANLAANIFGGEFFFAGKFEMTSFAFCHLHWKINFSQILIIWA